MDIRRASSGFLGAAIALLIIGVATDSWMGAGLFRTRDNTRLAVGALLVVGIALLLIAFILSIVSQCQNPVPAGLHLTYFIMLYLSVTLLLIGILVFTGFHGKNWSYFVATIGCTLALQVAILAAVFSRCRTSTTIRQERVIRTQS
ncbi:unnamed protein product [Schistocephalus solidus]|uniref:MARVEL domain-containing protein n=1 Tax=Schistocephalus solidus TaxID=70667 RepID=A0A183T4V9_SCHSO|nr:unnamed protein product [Schistocephalus solidus]